MALYTSAYKLFKFFLEQNSLWPDHLPNPPSVDEKTLIYFVAFCKERGLRYNTIKQYLSGLRHFYLKLNASSPLSHPADLKKLQIVLRGVKKTQSNITKPRLPITFKILQDIIHELDKGLIGQYDSLMFSAACTMAFFGFLRCGEFTVNNLQLDSSKHLSLADVSISSEKVCYNLTLKSSKTDVFRAGVQVPIHATHTHVCPVRYMTDYTNLRFQAGANSSDPLFINSKGQVLQRDFFLSSLKTILTKIGLNADSYSGHSFRIGAATTAAKAQVPDHLVKTLGRWSSDCYLSYIRTDKDTIARAQTDMCKL